MTVCQHCGARTHDMFLCADCTRRLERWLGDFPAIVGDLETTMAKLDRVRSGGKRGNGDDAPLVYRVTASEELWNCANTLGSWARHIYEARGAQIKPVPVDLLTHTERAATAIYASRLLLGAITAVRCDELAGQLFDEVGHQFHSAERMVDAPEQKIYVGKCEAPLLVDTDAEDGTVTLLPTDEHCPADLYARVTADRITCTECGATFDVADRERELKGRLADEWAHLDAIADGLSRLSEPVTKRRLDVWVKKDRAMARILSDRGIRPEDAGRPFLLARGKDDDGRLLFRVGDVLDRLAFAQSFEKISA